MCIQVSQETSKVVWFSCFFKNFPYFVAIHCFKGFSVINKSEVACFQVVITVKNPPANGGDIRDVDSIPGVGRCPGGGNVNSLQYSCLENPYGQRSLAGYSS